MKVNFLSSFIVPILLFILWFAFVFVGDVNFEGWSLLTVISILTFFILSIVMNKSLKNESNYISHFSTVLLLLALFFTLIPSLKSPFVSDLFYYSSFVGMFVSILFILFIHNNLFQKKIISYFSVVILILTFLYALIIKYDDPRLDIIYGPNVLYRIVLFFLGVVLVCLFNEKAVFYKILKIITIILASYLVFRTGSRGGLVSLAITLLIFSYHVTSLKYFIGICMLAITMLIYSLSKIVIEDYRILKFDGDSSDVRLDKVSAINDFISNGSFFLGSLDPTKYTGVHPHNVLIESLVYHGFFYYFVVQIALLVVFFQVWLNKNVALLFLPYCGICVGMFFSGSYIDNYPGLGVLLLIFILFLFNKTYLIKNS